MAPSREFWTVNSGSHITRLQVLAEHGDILSFEFYYSESFSGHFSSLPFQALLISDEMADGAGEGSAPGGIRTHNLLLRRQVLCPIELQGHAIYQGHRYQAARSLYTPAARRWF